MLVSHFNDYDPKWIALHRETGLVEKMLNLGFIYLRKADFRSQERYNTAFFNITIAFERLCKLIIDSEAYVNTGQFLTNGKLSNWGHDLSKLYWQVGSVMEESGHVVNVATPEDNEFLEDVLKFLTDFAKKDRYYNFISLDKSGASDPVRRWRRLVLRFKPQQKHQPWQNAMLVIAKEKDNVPNELRDIYYFDEEGNIIQSNEQCVESLFQSNHIQLEGSSFLYVIIKYLIACLDSFSEAEYSQDKVDSGSTISSFGSRAQLEARFAQPPVFRLLNYVEFFPNFRMSEEQYRACLQKEISERWSQYPCGK